MSKRLRLGAWVVALVAALAVLVGGIGVAFADVGDVPEHHKTREANGDGTYKLELTVTGDAETEKEEAGNVNVVVVYDVSSSMTSRAGSSQNSRADEAENVVHDFLAGLAEYQNTAKDNINVSLVTFGPTASQTQDWTTDVTAVANRFDDGTGEARNSYNFTYTGNNGTNWEHALMRATTLMDSAPGDGEIPTFVIMITDGAPTADGTTGNNPINPSGASIQQLRNRYNPATDDAYAVAQAAKATGGTFYGIYAYGTEADLLDDLMYFSENNQHRGGSINNVVAATEAAPNYFNAGNTSQLQAAIDEIFNQVVQALGISSVSISDGTTHEVSTTSGDVSELLEIDESSYQYWLDIPVANNKFTRIDREGNTVEYTVTQNGDGTCTVTWGSNSVTVNGTVSNGHFKYEWIEANALYNFDPPEAQLNDSAVDWDLASVGTLLDGVTYSVTFDVYPSQETYDMIAELKNGDLTYSEIDENVQQYLIDQGDDNYALETNTTATLSWTDTRPVGGPGSDTYNELEPVATAAESMSVHKKWENELDARTVGSIDMTVLMGDKEFTDVTLSKDTDPAWTEAPIYISTGLMRTKLDENGEEYMQILDTGHDFTFAELGPEQFNWELVAPVMHPMIIDGTLTMLIMVDTDHPKPEGATTYELNGKTYYVAGEGGAYLEAYNYRRSNLNLMKVVDGEDADPDQTFPFTLTVNNSGADDPQSTDTNSDNYVWFSIYDTNAAATVTNANVSGSGVVGPNADGYYYAPSGTAITVQMKAGWNLRFTNLPTETTYTFAEGTLPTNFTYDNTTLVATYGSGESATTKEGKAADKTFEGAQTTTGTIQETNSSYQVDFTNKYGLTDIEIVKVWDDNNNQDGKRPTVDEFKSWLKLLADGNDVTSDNANKLTVAVDPEDSNKYIAKWTGLNRYEEGEEIEYSVTETPSADYIADNATVDDHGTITNTHTPEKTETTVKKEWKDSDEDAETVRPKTITVELYKKVGEAAEQLVKSYTLEPDADGNWTLTVTGLDKYENGTEIEYFWKEVESSLEGLYSLTKTVVDSNTNTTTFTNSRVTIDTKTDVVLNKTVEAKGTEWAPKTFEFTITAGTATYEDGTTGTSPEATKPNGTATFNEAGTQPIDFGKISFIKAGTYTYKVKETTTSGGGWTCDNTEYDVEVTVSVDNDGKLTAEVTKVAEITNKYEPTGSVELEATKKISGADWPEGETITFTLAGEGGTLPETKTVTLTEAGTAKFEAITYTEADIDQEYTYTITEDGFGSGWTADPGKVVTAKVKVEDNGDGTLETTVTYDPADKTITNKYEAKGEETIEVTKALEGAAWPEGKTLTVTLAGADGAPMPETTEVKLTEEGTASFGPIAYDQTHVGKTFKYTVTEDGFGDGWTGTPAEITATVKVEDNGDGTLKTTVTYDPEDATFTNTYEAKGEAVLEATKAIEGADWPAGKTITFTLTGEGGTLPETTTKTLTSAGTVTFDAIKYTEADIDQEYTYTITEDGFGSGWTADPEQITAKVKVEDNGDGTLKTTITYTPEDKTITNKYEAKGEAVLEATKAISGADWPEGKTITFTLAGEGGTLPETKTVTLTEAGTAKFEAITYDESDIGKEYKYTITEDGFGTGWTGAPEQITATVKVTDKGDGTLATEISYDPENKTITNTYKAKGEAVLEATKAVEGADWPAGKSIVFTLAGEGGTLPETKTVTLTEAGTATFGAITYTEADIDQEYTYTITENGFGSGWTADPEQITAKVKVEDNGDGTLKTTITYTPEDATITNKYAAEGEAILQATKTISGADWPEGKSITFTLTGEGGTLPETTTKTLTSAGTVTFDAIKYTEVDIDKEYKYTITEDGFGSGWTGTPEQITATVKVTDNGNGTLKTTVTYDPENKTINNKYKAEGEATLEVEKELVGREWKDGESFTFTLYGPDGAKIEDKEVTANGSVSFTKLTYDESDAGKTYKYTIKETTDPLPDGVTKSGDVEATVVVTDKGDGTLDTQVTYDPENKTIINTYEAKPVKAQIEVEKKVDGFIEGTDVHGETLDRTFTITMTGPKIDGELSTTIKTKNGTGTATFPEIEYTFEDMVDDEGKQVTTKDFEYTVKETVETPAGWTYDSNEYTVTVTVEDDQNGKLVVTNITKVDESEGSPNVQIVNEYEEEGTEVTLHVVKEIDDQSDSAKDATFNFQLIDAEGATIDEKSVTTTDLKGEVDFEKLAFTEAGTYNYTIIEKVESQEPGWTYDDHEYAVKIVVADDFSIAELVVTEKTVDGEAVSDDTINVTFTNVYKAEATKATLKVTKEVDDKSGSADPNKTFTFTLAGDKYMPKTTTATIKAGDTAEFGPIDYDKAGTFKYTITETDGGGAAWTYDTTEYPVTVEVVDENAKLVATVTYDGTTTEVEGETILKVTNIYDPEDAKATPEARKLIKDLSKSAPDETFTFTLTPQDGAPGETQTVTRENGGPFSFSEITFDKVGTYNYTIQETAGSTNGFTYDTAEHALTITVTDPGDGQLKAEIKYADANEDGELVITNIYEAEPTSLVLDVEKVISGPVDPKKDATFTFELTGDAEMTTSVTGEGTASFDEIKYTEAGTYYYTVTEVPGDSDDYIYDGTVYTVTVEVVDEGGKLVATPTISADGADVDSIVFDNPYVPEVGLKVTKTVTSKPANGSYYKEGETVKYKIVVTNTGECDLTDVKVDDELTGDHWVVKKLAAGASKDFTTSYKVTKDDVKAGSVLNVVTAEADNPVDPDKPLKDKDKVKVPTGDDKTPPEPPHRKVVPQTGDDTPTGAMALMTVFGAAALTAGTVLKRKRK